MASSERIGTLYADEDGGWLSFSKAFSAQDTLYRADILRDLLHCITQEYHEAVEQMRAEFEAARARAEGRIQ